MRTASRSALRKVVLALGAIEGITILVFVGLILQASDPFGAAIGQGMAQLAAVPLLTCVVPGLALGLANRWLPLALFLLLLAMPVSFVLWLFA